MINSFGVSGKDVSGAVRGKKTLIRSKITVEIGNGYFNDVGSIRVRPPSVEHISGDEAAGFGFVISFLDLVFFSHYDLEEHGASKEDYKIYGDWERKHHVLCRLVADAVDVLDHLVVIRY